MNEEQLKQFDIWMAQVGKALEDLSRQATLFGEVIPAVALAIKHERILRDMLSRPPVKPQPAPQPATA